MEIRHHTLNNEKLIDLTVRDLSKAITLLYKDQKSLFKQFEAKLLEGEYVTPTIYFVKRQLINFELEELYEALEALEDTLHRPLYLSFLNFLDQGNTHSFSMYLVKNRHVRYVKTRT